MVQIERTVTSPAALATLAIGSVLSAGGSAPKQQASADDWADMVDEMQRWALSSRLGIPIIYGSDAVHGHDNLYGATIFPHNVGLGATRSNLFPSPFFAWFPLFQILIITDLIVFEFGFDLLEQGACSRDWRGDGIGS